MLLGGSEDPWLCVADFGQVCLCRLTYLAQLEQAVNSGIYLIVHGLIDGASRNPRAPITTLWTLKRYVDLVNAGGQYHQQEQEQNCPVHQRLFGNGQTEVRTDPNG